MWRLNYEMRELAQKKLFYYPYSSNWNERYEELTNHTDSFLTNSKSILKDFIAVDYCYRMHNVK